MKSNFISIVIPSCGHRVNLAGLVTSLRQQQEMTGKMEVLVVLNNHEVSQMPDLKNELVSLLGDIKIFELTQKGVNRARNFGLAEAQGEIVYFVDDDCAFEDKQLLVTHLELHRNNPEVFAFGGGYKLPATANNFDKIYNLIQMKWFYSGFTGAKHNNCFRTHHLLGGNFSVKKNLSELHQLNFDENIVYGSSEYDYYIQAYLKKLTLMATEKELVHYTNEKFSSIAKKVFLQGFGKKHLDKKYGQPINTETTPEDFKVSLRVKLFLLFYNYCYWYGYFYEESKLLKIVKLVLKDSFNYLNLLRYRILKNFQN